MFRVLSRLTRDQRGLETVEYAIIVSLIVAGTIIAIAAVAVWVSNVFIGFQTTVGA